MQTVFHFPIIIPGNSQSLPSESIDTINKGDVNNDKKVNIFDSVALKRFVAGIETDIDKNNADFNSDGNIGISDLIQLNKFLIKY